MNENLECIGAKNCPDERCQMVKDYINSWGWVLWKANLSGEEGCGVMNREAEGNIQHEVPKETEPTKNAGMRFGKGI